MSGEQDEPQSTKLEEPGAAANAWTTGDREALILVELGATLNTIQNVSEVLSDILRLTDPSTTSSKKGDNVAIKQQKLLKELKEWRFILPTTKNKQGEESLESLR
jgi:hypothetical protein